MTKEFLLSKLGAIREAVEALPDDVIICSINEHGILEKSRLIIQIMEHPEVKGKRVYPMNDAVSNGDWWCEIPGEVHVGYIEDGEKDD